jgi:thiol-disulfide isomerase/thioredoxin
MHPRHSTLHQVLIGLLLLICSQAHAQSGIQFFEGSLQAAIDKAAAEEKLVFVDGYAEWCGPCKWMAANAFQDASVGTFFNHHFVATQIDLEKGEGPDIARRFDVQGYPTLVFLDGKGHVRKQSVGAEDAAGLLELAQAVLRLAKPELAGKGEPGDPGYVPETIFKATNLSTAFAKARAESKLVFVYLENPFGGVANPALAKATFSHPDVVRAVADKVVCLTVSEFGLRGEEFDSLYPAMSHVNRPIFAPALVFFKADGSLAENWFHDVDVPTFLSLLAAAQGEPGKTLVGKKARIAAGEDDEDFLYDYLLHTHRAGLHDMEALAAFLPALRGQRLLEDRAWDIYCRYRNCFDGAFHDEILPLIPDLMAKYGRDSIVAELHRWRDDEIDHFGAIEEARAFDPGIQRLTKIAHLDPQLQIDLAYLQMLKAAFSEPSPQAEQALLRSGHALLDRHCDADDVSTLCYYLYDLVKPEGKAKRATLLAVLDLCERMTTQHATGAAYALQAMVLLDLRRNGDAWRAYNAALLQPDLEDVDRCRLLESFGK